MTHEQSILTAAGLTGVAGIVLGALGAHALEETLAARETAAAWDTAVRYHLFHTAALLAAGIWVRVEPGLRGVVPAAWCWVAGLLLFSGSLYALSLGAPAALGPVTPLGGLVFMLGWGWLITAAFRTGKKATREVPRVE